MELQKNREYKTNPDRRWLRKANPPAGNEEHEEDPEDEAREDLERGLYKYTLVSTQIDTRLLRVFAIHIIIYK